MIEVFIARLIFLIKAESQFQLSIFFFFLHVPETDQQQVLLYSSIKIEQSASLIVIYLLKFIIII